MNSSIVKVMFRNFIRNKTYSLINIVGLAVGITCTLLIINWVNSELSFDKYHTDSDRIYRIERDPFCTLAPSFVPLLKQDFPEIEKIARMVDENGARLKYKERSYIEDKVFAAEQDIIEIFSLKMAYGEEKTALAQPNSIVLTESMAHKYFGKENPLGKIVLLEDTLPLTVTGVIKDVPVNTHLHFNFLISYVTLKSLFGQRGNDYYFGNHNFSDNVCLTYARLAKGSDPRALEAKFPKFIDRYVDSYKDDGGKFHLASEYNPIKLIKVADIHLYSHGKNEIETNGDIKYVKIFSLVAIFILLIACMNFINLSIAKSLKRAKDVGLRKVLGSKQSSIVADLILESTIYILISLIIAVVLYNLISPYLSSIWDGWANQSLFSNKSNFLLLFVILLFCNITAGLYPAIFISRFKPTDAVKNSLRALSLHSSKAERSPLRKSLIVLQFSISIAIMICMGIIYKQLKFIQTSNLGFNKENVVLLPADGAILIKWTEFKHDLLNHPGIKQVTKSKRTPSDRLLDAPGFEIVVDGKLIKNSFFIPHNRVEHDFFKTYGMTLVAGRDFDISNRTDASSAVILNETAIQQLGFKTTAEALGNIMKINGEDKTIIGVVRDFHYESFHYKISAIATYISNETTTIGIRIAGGNIKEKLSVIENVWNAYHNGSTMTYSFLGEKIEKQYKNEQMMLTLFNYFGLLAIFIACLGLYGLATFSTERRTKEIGIRKSTGATTKEILLMLSVDFTKWVVIAFLIICPITYFIMHKWLENFAYKTELSWWVFALAGLVAVAVAVLTVSWQSWRAATRNPVESLRYE